MLYIEVLCTCTSIWFLDKIEKADSIQIHVNIAFQLGEWWFLPWILVVLISATVNFPPTFFFVGFVQIFSYFPNNRGKPIAGAVHLGFLDYIDWVLPPAAAKKPGGLVPVWKVCRIGTARIWTGDLLSSLGLTLKNLSTYEFECMVVWWLQPTLLGKNDNLLFLHSCKHCKRRHWKGRLVLKWAIFWWIMLIRGKGRTKTRAGRVSFMEYPLSMLRWICNPAMLLGFQCFYVTRIIVGADPQIALIQLIDSNLSWHPPLRRWLSKGILPKWRNSCKVDG